MSQSPSSKVKLTLQSFEETLRATKATNFFATWRSSKQEASRRFVEFLTGKKHPLPKVFSMVEKFFTDKNINSESDLKSNFSPADNSSLSENQASNMNGSLSIGESQDEIESIICSALGIQVSSTCKNVYLVCIKKYVDQILLFSET